MAQHGSVTPPRREDEEGNENTTSYSLLLQQEIVHLQGRYLNTWDRDGMTLRFIDQLQGAASSDE
jgi:hypothetical protein